MAVAMIIVGLLVGFGAIIFAMINITSNYFDFDRMMRRHLVAGVTLALGGLIALIGLVLALFA